MPGAGSIQGLRVLVSRNRMVRSSVIGPVTYKEKRGQTMKLRILTIKTMISLCWFWLKDGEARRVLSGHTLGRAMLEQIRRVLALLQNLHALRNQGRSEIDRLGDELTALDNTHDRKARALYNHLLALIAGTDDAAFAAWCNGLLQLLFPQGLAIINYSYADEAGGVMAIEGQVTAEMLARMATIKVGEQTLADLYQAWITAGTTLGERAYQRAQLQASMSGSGPAAPAINLTQVRSEWIRMARTLILSCDLMGLSAADRDILLAPLAERVNSADRSDTLPSTDTDSDIDPDVDSDIDPDVDSDIDPSALVDDDPGVDSSAEIAL